MNKALTQNFFENKVTKVAYDLVGCYLVRKIEDETFKYLITEVEAYDGEKDLACHARVGRTQRTEIMYMEGGHIYIYLIYGMYWMLNIVTGPKDYPAAVLIRGVEGIEGPGRLTNKLKIDKSLNGKILGEESGLWIEQRNRDFKDKIIKSPRIGVDYAGPIWSKKHYRFSLKK
jgi:DNA-3-methyladenine glycosylase